MHTDFFVEKIPPANERGEDPIVVVLIIAVLSVAVLLLWLRQPQQVAAVERVPNDVRQVLTELSVAATEVNMIAELNDKLPTIDELRESGVTPFVNDIENGWVEAKPGCYLGTRGLFDLRLKIDGSLTNISWRKISVQPATKVDGMLEITLCNTDALKNNDGGWNTYEPLQLVHKSTNDKHTH